MFTKTKKLNILLLLVFILIIFPVDLSGAKKNVHKTQTANSVPAIYSRSSWSNAKYDKRTKKIWPAKYENPEVVIIHHTATSYNYSTSKQIKKIYKYHSYTRKWGDIGYNYVIGKDGLIFEGRYGGNGVIAGHSYYNGTNYNEGSIGIAVLGNYENEDLSSAARDSLEKLIGWLAANNNISIKSSIKFHGKSLDNAVIGHKNVASTACPGKNIYSLMSGIRTSAANLSGIYRDYAYQIPSEGEKYDITGGKRYSGSSKVAVAQISKTQLKAYPSGGIAERSGDYNYPSGTLLMSGGQRAMLENGVLRLISSSSALESSYGASSFVEVTSGKWSSYSNGTEASFRNGSFVKDSDGNYYIISENQRRKLVLSNEDLKLVNLSTAHDISSGDNSRYLSGENITSAANFPEGMLVTNNNKKFYYVLSNGTKKKITKNVFRATFSSSMAVRISSKLLKRYKTKGKLSFQNGAVVSYRGKYYFIESGQRRQFASKNLAVSMGYKNIQKAKRTEMAGIGKGARVE